jgi:hypothetical protein
MYGVIIEKDLMLGAIIEEDLDANLNHNKEAMD